MGPRIMRLEHVNITAPEDLEEQVVAWYEKSLGLERIEKPEGTRPHGAWFRAGEQEIHVSRDEHNPPQTAHFCLVADDLDAVIEQLRSDGCHIEQASQLPGRKRFYTRDPAGNRIEITAYAEGA